MSALRNLAAALLLCGVAARAQQPERITFPDAVQRALARNPSVHIALQEISRAHGIMREVRAAAIPTLSGNAVYTRLDADRTTAAAVVDSTTTPPTVSSVSRTVQPRDSWTANLQLVVPLVAPLRGGALPASAGRRQPARGRQRARAPRGREGAAVGGHGQPSGPGARGPGAGHFGVAGAGRPDRARADPGSEIGRAHV